VVISCASLLALHSLESVAQEANPGRKTDASMFWKKTGEQITRVESPSGDLYRELGHHGPAIENLWVAYRFYFNETMSVDVLSKFKPRLELETSQWYGNDSLFSLGYGKDNVKVWKTVGIGGLRLWDHKLLAFFETKTNRIGEVAKTDSTAGIKITSLDVPYGDQLIDIEVKMTVFDNERYASVETTVLSGEKVNFATGLVTHPGLKIEKTDRAILTWGDYDSPAASEAFDVGAAIVYNDEVFDRRIEEEDQLIIISKPVSYLKYYITSSNEKESSDLNSFQAFSDHVNRIKDKL